MDCSKCKSDNVRFIMNENKEEFKLNIWGNPKLYSTTPTKCMVCDNCYNRWQEKSGETIYH